jgi:hypothetical protein
MSLDKNDVSLKVLTKDLLRNQLNETEKFIENAQSQIIKLQNQVQQSLGVAGLAKHLLEAFNLPEKDETK